MERNEDGNYLANHSIYFMISIFETFCVSNIESLGSRLSVITTAHGGGSIELINKTTSCVVNVRDFHVVAEKLDDIYLGKLRFEPQVIREHVISVCGSEAFKRRLIGYYEQAMVKKV